MLIQFTVKNFKSIQNTVTLDLQAMEKVREHPQHVRTDQDDDEFLPLAAIYGPNGSGKTNVLEAIETLRAIVTGEASVGAAIPYFFSDDSKKEPTKFELIFRTREAEYRYRMHIMEGAVIYENLDRIRFATGRRSALFERTGNDVSLKRTFCNIQMPKEQNRRLPFLNWLMNRYPANDVVLDVAAFFHEGMRSIYKEEMATDVLLECLKEEDVWDLFRQMIQETDLDIADFRVNGEHIFAVHEVNGRRYDLPFAAESSGTRKLLYMLSQVANSLLKGQTLLLDSGLLEIHPELLRHIMGYYLEKKSNRRLAQLLLTTYDMSTLSCELLRRDEIWFAAKNEQQSTVLYSMADFTKGTGKSRKYAVRYLEGVYGANPYVRDTINWNKIFNDEVID